MENGILFFAHEQTSIEAYRWNSQEGNFTFSISANNLVAISIKQAVNRDEAELICQVLLSEASYFEIELEAIKLTGDVFQISGLAGKKLWQARLQRVLLSEINHEASIPFHGVSSIGYNVSYYNTEAQEGRGIVMFPFADYGIRKLNQVPLEYYFFPPAVQITTILSMLAESLGIAIELNSVDREVLDKLYLAYSHTEAPKYNDQYLHSVSGYVGSGPDEIIQCLPLTNVIGANQYNSPKLIYTVPSPDKYVAEATLQVTNNSSSTFIGYLYIKADIAGQAESVVLVSVGAVLVAGQSNSYSCTMPVTTLPNSATISIGVSSNNPLINIDIGYTFSIAPEGDNSNQELKLSAILPNIAAFQFIEVVAQVLESEWELDDFTRLLHFKKAQKEINFQKEIKYLNKNADSKDLLLYPTLESFQQWNVGTGWREIAIPVMRRSNVAELDRASMNYSVGIVLFTVNSNRELINIILNDNVQKLLIPDVFSLRNSVITHWHGE